MPEVPTIRKKRNLEIFLEKVPVFPSPDPKMEQYKTPATIAADIIFNAYGSGDIEGKEIVDLGCGTGIFAVGAVVMGAKSVRGLDIAADAVSSAKGFADNYDLEIDFEIGDITECDWKCDTVLQNPPFGAQSRKADRAFLETAVKIGSVVYSIHNARTNEFIRLLVDKLGYTISFEKKYIFKIEHTFDFHTKDHKNNEVTLFRIVEKE